MAKAKANFLQEVKEQYEDLPYPPRDPQDEKKIIMAPYIEIIERFNHYCFQGKRDFRKKFRVLVAGGGTGDCSVFMAEQYGTLGAEIVHLDLSKASIAVAKERLKVRGLEGKVEFLHASILDIPKMNLGKFDYINCSGVLHHLANPEEGLAALESVLLPDGIMGLMVYGKYGRHSIYPMQETLRLITKNVSQKQKKIKISRTVLDVLPNNNWFKLSKNMFLWDLGTDNGFYDLLLHPQDRAYSVPELYDFLRSSNLNHVCFQDENTSGENLYDPKRFVIDLYKEEQEEIDKLSIVEKQALAELLASNMIKHTFYVSRKPFAEPDINDEEYVPVINYMFSVNMKALLKMVLMHQEKQVMCTNQNGNHTIFVDVFPSTAALIIAIDGKRKIKEIVDEVSSKMNLKREEVLSHFRFLYKDLRTHDLVFLRHSSIPAYENLDQIHANMMKRTQS